MGWLLALLAGVAQAAPVQPPSPPASWSWNLYDDRSTPCWLYERLQRECAQGECNEKLLRDFQKRCGVTDKKGVR